MNVLERKWGVFAIVSLAALVALAGCSTSSDDDDDDSGGGGSAVIIIGASGDGVDVTGTWFGCSNDTDGTTYVFGDGTLTVTITTHVDAGCTDEGTVGDEFDGTVDVLADEELVGWSDGAATAAAPDKQDTSGALDDPPTGTPVELTVDGELLGTLALLVDDTGDAPLLYRDHDEPAECAADSETDFGKCLHTIDTMEQQ